MKKVSLIVVLLCLASFISASEASALRVDESELKASGSQAVEFINNAGTNENASFLKAVGYRLGEKIELQKTSSMSTESFHVVHIVADGEEDKLNADIIYMEKGSVADHIAKLRAIISGYLSAVYSYPQDEADNLAVLITVYNAFYRGKYDAFVSKYKSEVVENLTAQNCGLSKRWDEWQGQSRIVIPLHYVSVTGDIHAAEPATDNGGESDIYLEDNDDSGFGLQKIRYDGFAFGAHFTTGFAAGEWSEFVTATIGGGADVEFTLPLSLPVFDLGVSFRFDCGAMLPKENSIVKGGCDVTLSAGAFLRLPFHISRMTFAFQPELSYGIVFHNVSSDESIEGFYVDQQLCLSLGLRMSIPKLENLEIELAPQFMSFFEESDAGWQIGFRLGAVWHLYTK